MRSADLITIHMMRFKGLNVKVCKMMMSHFRIPVICHANIKAVINSNCLPQLCNCNSVDIL